MEFIGQATLLRSNITNRKTMDSQPQQNFLQKGVKKATQQYALKPTQGGEKMEIASLAMMIQNLGKVKVMTMDQPQELIGIG